MSTALLAVGKSKKELGRTVVVARLEMNCLVGGFQKLAVTRKEGKKIQEKRFGVFGRSR